MNALRHAVVVTLAHWKVGAQYEVQYRLNFALQVVQSAVQLVTGIVAIRLVFDHTGDLAGWGESELLAVLGVHILLGGIMRAFVLPNMFAFMREVGEGELDFALLRPVDAQVFVSTRRIDFWSLVDTAVGCIVLGWAVRGLDTVTVGGVATFVVAAFCGAVILYSVWMAFTTTAFWLIDVDDMAQLLDGLYDAGRSCPWVSPSPFPPRC